MLVPRVERVKSVLVKQVKTGEYREGGEGVIAIFLVISGIRDHLYHGTFFNLIISEYFKFETYLSSG